MGFLNRAGWPKLLEQGSFAMLRTLGHVAWNGHGHTRRKAVIVRATMGHVGQ
jgi:hypothetical protein